MKDENKKSLLLILTKEEHRLLKDRANQTGLSIKEFILLSVYNLIENNPKLIKHRIRYKKEIDNLK